MTKKVVSFHDDPPSAADSAKYKEALNRAKANQRDKPSNLENTPRFDQAATWSEPAQTGDGFLSADTKRGLENMARAAKMEQKAAEQSQKVQEQSQEFHGQEVEEEEEELTQEEKLKRVIEGRLEEIDIGQYLMSGEIRQEVPIIPGKLVVVFKTVTDLEESYVDTVMSGDSNLTSRQFLRKMNELALSIHIYSVNGNKWPTNINGDGNVNKESIDARLKQIRKLSSPIFNMISQNLSWFIDRVNNSLNASILGNG